jgi:hypothetical protein
LVAPACTVTGMRATCQSDGLPPSLAEAENHLKASESSAGTPSPAGEACAEAGAGIEGGAREVRKGVVEGICVRHVCNVCAIHAIY